MSFKSYCAALALFAMITPFTAHAELSARERDQVVSAVKSDDADRVRKAITDLVTDDPSEAGEIISLALSASNDPTISDLIISTAQLALAPAARGNQVASTNYRFNLQSIVGTAEIPRRSTASPS